MLAAVGALLTAIWVELMTHPAIPTTPDEALGAARTNAKG